MKWFAATLAVGGLLLSTNALAQVENGDLRIRAEFRMPDNDEWGSNESAGHAEFRIKSRFMQVYYGGVMRNDEYRFKVAVDFSEMSGFDTEFESSPYNIDYDVYINDDFVGRAIMGLEDDGVASLDYDSRHPTPPQLPIPADFPEPVEVGDVVRVFPAAAVEPEIGDPFPGSAPWFTSTLGEEFPRGDVNQDGDVDEADFPALEANFDPTHATGLRIGPASGDFTGDNFSDLADYQLMVTNWTGNEPPPPLSGVAAVGPGAGRHVLELLASFPNPFAAATSIRFRLAEAGDVRVDFFDVTGALVASRQAGRLAAGAQSVEFDGRAADGRPLPNGKYFYRVQVGAIALTQSLILSR